MKIPFPFLSFVLATGLAYGTGVMLLPRKSSKAGAKAGTIHQSMTPAEAAAALQKEIAAAAGESGTAMKERLEASFKLLGIENSWAEALSANTATGFPALMDKLKTTNTAQRAMLELMLLDRWAQLDPESGAAYFKAIADETPGDRLADDGLANFIKQWGTIDFEKAAAKAGEYGDKTTRRTLREKAKMDPTGFLAWANSHPEINPMAIFVSGSSDNRLAIAHLADLDLDRVLAWAKNAPDSKWHAELGPILAEKLARRDPDAAIKWAKELGEKSATSAALSGIAKTLAETDPDRAMLILKEMGSGTSNFRNFDSNYRGIIEKLGLNDPAKAMTVMEELPKGELRDQVLSQVLGKLMASDPAKAFALAEKMGKDGTNRYGVDESVFPKNPTDARRLLDLAEKAGDSNFRNQVASTALMGWMQADQRSLAEYLNGKNDSPMLQKLREQMGQGLAEMLVQSGQPIDPLLEKAAGIKPETKIQAIAQRNPEAAAAQLDQLTDPGMRLNVVQNIAANWSRRDRGDAVDWAAGLTNPDEQAAAYRSLSSDWMQEDSYKASEWISKLSAGKPRDAAVASMTQQIAFSDPDLSLKWSLTMTDPDLRGQALATTFQAWNNKDAGAAQAALTSPGLSEAERSVITAAMQNPNPAFGNRSIRRSSYYSEGIYYSE